MCYCTQFHPYVILQECADILLGLAASVVGHLVNTLPNVGDSNYPRVMDEFWVTATFEFQTNCHHWKSKGKPNGKCTIAGFK